VQNALADSLFQNIPAGVGSKSAVSLDLIEMDLMLAGGARWAVKRGWGERRDLERIEERGTMAGAKPELVSERAKERQRREMGTLGSGNHYLEVQAVAEILDASVADAFGLVKDQVVVTIHCGSRGLGHQIGTEFLKEMVMTAKESGIELPDRELACAPIHSEVGQRYLGAMRAATNCALANREILVTARGASSDISFRIATCACFSMSRTIRVRSRCTSSTESGGNSLFIARERPGPLAPAMRVFQGLCDRLVSPCLSVAAWGRAHIS
jgi:RNA-splicing ligase RtcB